jgi:hypothetical protein
VEVSKGPYYVEYGDFNTAGAVSYLTRDIVEENLIEVTYGMCDIQRYLTLLSPLKGPVKSLFALEGFLNDDPYDNPNNYHRFNGLAKFTMNPTPTSELTLIGTHYRGESNASGQIPLRAVEEDRMGSLSPLIPLKGENRSAPPAACAFVGTPAPAAPLSRICMCKTTNWIYSQILPSFSMIPSTVMALSNTTTARCTADMSVSARPATF